MSRSLQVSTSRRRARLTAMAVLVGVCAPHMVRPSGLPIWVSAAFLALAGARVAIEIAGRAAPPRWLIWLVASALCAPLPVAFGYHPSRELFLALLTLLVGLKVLEARSLRDWAVTVFLSQFLVLTNFLYSQSVSMALYLVAAAWLGLVALADLSDPVGDASARVNGRLATRLLLQALPLTAVLFLLFPRIQGQLWSLPEDRSSGLTGLSEELSPGAVQRVVLSEEVAFRVAFTGQAPPAAPWYWRGLVLEQSDGQRWWWEAPGYRDAAVEPLAPGDRAEYTVTLEPHGKRWLFALDIPAAAPAGGRLLPGRQLIATTPVRELRRYRAESLTRYRTGPLSGAERDRNLAVPRATPRVRALAAQWRAGAARDELVVERALRHFATGGYAYTLTPPMTSREYVEEFLFETRRGFCEHFAASFTVLMRLAGVPSRVVLGYLGGEQNPVGEFWVVRQAQAHAWAEVWLEDRGWVRVDPTAVVQPERLTGLVDGQGGLAGVRYVRPPADWVRKGLLRLRILWGAAENTWDQMVLGYDVVRQARMLRRLGIAEPTWRHLAAGLGACATAVLAALAGLAAWRAVPRGDPLQRAYGRFCARLGRRGLPRLASETPLAYARRAAARWPAQGPRIKAITDLYLRARFGPRAPPGAARSLRQAMRGLRPPRRGGSPAVDRVPIIQSHGRG